MGLLGWVMMGFALWHFTIWLPDHFWAGIVGGLIGALVGAIVGGFIVYAIAAGELAVPGAKATDIGVVLYAVPGCLLGMAVVYLIGMRREPDRGSAPA